MYTRTGKLALAAAVILIVLGGVTFWPSGDGKWWLQPPAAWGQGIIESLEKINVLIYREGNAFVGDYGSTHVSGNWDQLFTAPDRQRRDRYFHDTLVGTTWKVPGEPGYVLKYEVSYEFQCYTIETRAASESRSDPVELLRHYVNLLDKADRILDPQTFEGKECVGFEIKAAEYGGSPKQPIDRIWFAKDTKLPVRIEHHGIPITGQPDQTLTRIHDQFQYASEVSVDLFEPQIPEGFVNERPDTIRKARERQEKGEMVYANVPAGLKKEVFAAFRKMATVAYTEGGRRFFGSRDAWRVDYPEGDHIRKATWHVIHKSDDLPTNLDFNDKGFRLVDTTVDYDDRTFEQVERSRTGWHGHPMDNIAFLLGLMDRADRFYESQEVDGVTCFGFDVSAKKYGTNPDGAFHRVWLDAATRLPVRTETHWPNSNGAGVHVTVREQFQWDPTLPEDFFTPQIPPGFVQIEK